jgi:hypothetical protein
MFQDSVKILLKSAMIIWIITFILKFIGYLLWFIFYHIILWLYIAFWTYLAKSTIVLIIMYLVFLILFWFYKIIKTFI